MVAVATIRLPYRAEAARMREIRALIVDDEPLARRGIRQLLEREADVTVVGEARNGREALRALRTLDPEPGLSRRADAGGRRLRRRCARAAPSGCRR